MEIRSRFSMNTSLKNAHIFDDDSLEDNLNSLIKKEDIGDDLEELAFDPHQTATAIINKDDIGDELEELAFDPHQTKRATTKVKQELFDEDTNFPISQEAFENIHIKKEVLEELTSPMKVDIYENSDSNSRKSLRSAKLNLYKKRDSPYKTPIERFGPSSSKVTCPDFGENNRNQKQKRRKKEFETDPQILSRRQKQIDYGKNTVGYDEYCRQVPKHQRKPEDPQTPNKYLKYSRRGFDGLIKQWRQNLHKYDPQD